MKTVVITGSTRGIGFGLADAFLKLGCEVVVNGRQAASVEEARRQLASRHSADRILAHACDVTAYQQVQALWDAAAGRFGTVDVWINNAGLGNIYRPAWEQTPQELEAIVLTNVLGVMYGTQVAFLGMRAQGFGQIFNMQGAGSNGRIHPGLTVYGSTKRGVDYFTRSFILEAAGGPVKIGTLSPGMVITELLTDAFEDPEELARYKRLFSTLGDRVETVTPWLARQVLANQKHGAHVHWLTRGKVIWRFLSAPFNPRDLFDEDAADS